MMAFKRDGGEGKEYWGFDGLGRPITLSLVAVRTWRANAELPVQPSPEAVWELI